VKKTGQPVLDQFRCLVSKNADIDVDAVAAQAHGATSRYARIRIETRNDHPTEFRENDRVDTRRRPALVVARLESDIKRRPSRTMPCRKKRDDLGVRAPGALVPSEAHRLALVDDESSHAWIRRRLPPRRHTESEPHPLVVRPDMG
jgi:hypothetical protein